MGLRTVRPDKLSANSLYLIFHPRFPSILNIKSSLSFSLQGEDREFIELLPLCVTYFIVFLYLAFSVGTFCLEPIIRNNLVQREYVHLLILGTLSKEDDDDDSENVCKKINYLIASIWTCSICQMQATFPGVEFLRILFKFKKRKENSSSYVHVLHKTSN